ncbi:hypothetical protein [Lysobacter sp. D1-1-M9]|uniref:hypothetical protein n=2 Tax=Novilysobacter TaxID=3382699 RepID=UPI002FCA2C17
MRFADYLQQRPLPVIVAAGVVLGLAVGVAWPLPEPSATAADQAGWHLPDPAVIRRYDEAQFTAVRDATVWGAAETPEESDGASRRPEWRLTGIIANPEFAALVATAGDRKVAHVGVGGTLPDGGEVVRITQVGITFTRDGCTHERILHQPIDPAEHAPCVPSPTTP